MLKKDFIISEVFDDIVVAVSINFLINLTLTNLIAISKVNPAIY